jgi:hypothetical protein
MFAASRAPFDGAPSVVPVDCAGLIAGGGGTTAAAGARGAVREIPLPVADGAGGTTCGASVEPELRFGEPTLGGGGTTLLASSRDDVRVPEVTLGGGGTTFCVPKILPMMLLMNDGGCAGGGGTTLGVVATPLSSRRKSCVDSEGGGAITDGAGRFSLAFLRLSRSGALTGGGTTSTLVI